MRETILRLRQEMGLTILLSSHLLSEVEQLCTRIAVMNQGRKVFEGSLASIQQAQNWFRLRVNDFTNATALLKQHRLVDDIRDGEVIALAGPAKPEQVVACLVQNGYQIREIGPEVQDLEGFYLSLMRNGEGSRSGVTAPAVSGNGEAQP